ncbi:hypothetical protein J132_01910 [Termitomyces sp. J132]|nr:hypothetical protein J132_01910 [Termitomyces sp. J132]
MALSPAPALFVGLGARIALDYFTRSGEATVRDFVLIGVWQGVGLHYASKITVLAIIVGLAIAAKLLVEFNFINDITRTVTTLLGIALGVLCTECLSQVFDSPKGGIDSERPRKRASLTPDDHALRRDRLVQFHTGVEGDRSDARHRAFRETVHGISDITSVGSHSDMIGPSASLSPLEIEIKTLRARAALADSERRRCKEERKWAISQGNLARASQMKSHVTHYTTLMQKFNMEADAKMLQGEYHIPSFCFQTTISISASNAHSRLTIPEEAKPSSSRLPNRNRRESANGQPIGQGHKPPSKLSRPRREPSSGLTNGQDPRPSSSRQPPWPLRSLSSGQPNGQVRNSSEAKRPSKPPRP